MNFETGEYSLLHDIPFKETFGRKKRSNFAEYFLECYLKLPIGSLHGKVEVLLDETLEKNHLSEHGMVLDVVLIYNDVIYNIEVYQVFDKASLHKTLAYNGKIFSSKVK